jgi:hypothetical protein
VNDEQVKEIAELQGRIAELRDLVVKLLGERDMHMQALATVNAHLRAHDHAYRDMAREAQNAVQKAAELEASVEEIDEEQGPEVKAITKRLAPVMNQHQANGK